MNKYHFAHVPNQDMFSGLVHGSFHALRSQEEHKDQLAVVYLDITAHAATSALYAILKRPHIKGMMPCAYIDNQSVRGFTAAREFSIFLSPSLDYVDQKQLGVDLLRFFDAVEATSRSGNSFIGVYRMSNSSAIDSLRDAAYDRFLGPEYGHQFLPENENEVQSNISVKDVLAFALDRDCEKLVLESHAQTFMLGAEFDGLDMKVLHKFIRAANNAGRRVTMNQKLLRKYFMGAICKY